jgi:presenilin-like A22 family membrane protease
MGSLFIIIDILALLLVAPLSNVGMFAFEDSGDPFNIVYFVAMMLVTTGAILLLRKFRRGDLVKWILRGTIWVSLFSTAYSLTWLFIDDPAALIISLISSLSFIYVLSRWPRWYIVDTAALLLGSVTTAIVGISLNSSLVVALLAVLAVYDAISVYKTGHMLTLAETILGSGLPLMVVIPKTRGYGDMEKIEIRKEAPPEGSERRGFYMGLGDLVLPSCLVVSIYWSLDWAGLPIMGAVILGTLLGFVALSTLVAKGKPQAGLPFLCGGAILGWVISNLILFGRIIW